MADRPGPRPPRRPPALACQIRYGRRSRRNSGENFLYVFKGGSLRSPPAPTRPRRACDPFRPVPAHPARRSGDERPPRNRNERPRGTGLPIPSAQPACGLHGAPPGQAATRSPPASLDPHLSALHYAATTGSGEERCQTSLLGSRHLGAWRADAPDREPQDTVRPTTGGASSTWTSGCQ
jgi:hypothetical protein